jgi:hypothetical protein
MAMVVSGSADSRKLKAHCHFQRREMSDFGESTNALARELNVAALGMNMTV